jgi:hypothetical protein
MKCVCVKRPIGFDVRKDEVYKCEYIRGVVRYYRVYVGGVKHYETLSTNTFEKHFQEVHHERR